MATRDEQRKGVWATGYWAGILPEHIDAARVINLIDTIESQLSESPIIRDALEACELQPTTRPTWLAASAAVHVLLAHEIGQEVARDQLGGECDYPGCTNTAPDTDTLCAEHRKLINALATEGG